MSLLNSIIATTLPVSKLGAYRAGLVDMKGNPTVAGILAPVENEARSHYHLMVDYRRSLKRLQADPDMPLRDEWISRTISNADFHRRRLVELLSQRRRMRAELLKAYGPVPVIALSRKLSIMCTEAAIARLAGE